MAVIVCIFSRCLLIHVRNYYLLVYIIILNANRSKTLSFFWLSCWMLFGLLVICGGELHTEYDVAHSLMQTIRCKYFWWLENRLRWTTTVRDSIVAIAHPWETIMLTSRPGYHKLAKHFTSCHICGGPFRSARVLPCLHVFCQACLERYWRLELPPAGHSEQSTSSSSPGAGLT